MKTRLVPCILFAALVPCSAGVINFDDQSTSGGAVALTNQYLSSGVLFQDIYAAQNFKFNIFPPSVPNYASPFWVDLNPGFIIFVAPGNPGIDTTVSGVLIPGFPGATKMINPGLRSRSEEHTSELQSLTNLVCRLLLEKKKNNCQLDTIPPIKATARRKCTR